MTHCMTLLPPPPSLPHPLPCPWCVQALVPRKLLMRIRNLNARCCTLIIRLMYGYRGLLFRGSVLVHIIEGTQTERFGYCQLYNEIYENYARIYMPAFVFQKSLTELPYLEAFFLLLILFEHVPPETCCFFISILPSFGSKVYFLAPNAVSFFRKSMSSQGHECMLTMDCDIWEWILCWDDLLIGDCFFVG